MGTDDLLHREFEEHMKRKLVELEPIPAGPDACAPRLRRHQEFVFAARLARQRVRLRESRSVPTHATFHTVQPRITLTAGGVTEADGTAKCRGESMTSLVDDEEVAVFEGGGDDGRSRWWLAEAAMRAVGLLQTGPD